MTEQKWNIRARSIAAIALSTPFLAAAAAPARDYFDRADLRAQQEMVSWAAAMTVSAWIGLIVSLVGVILLWRTLLETRRAAAVTMEAAEATVMAARETLAAEQRPWISVEVGQFSHMRYNDNGSVTGRLKVVWTNVGKAPATNAHRSVKMIIEGASGGYYHELIMLEQELLKLRAMHGEDVILPGQSVVEDVRINVGPAVMAKIQQAQFSMPVVIGCCTYRSTYFRGAAITKFWGTVVAPDGSGNDMVVNLKSAWWNANLQVIETSVSIL